MGSLLWLFIKLINQGLLQYLSVKLICSWSALKGLCRSGRWWFMMLPDAVEQSITSMTYKLYRFRRARPSSWSCLCILWLSYLEWVDYIKLTLTMIIIPFPIPNSSITFLLSQSCLSGNISYAFGLVSKISYENCLNSDSHKMFSIVVVMVSVYWIWN